MRLLLLIAAIIMLSGCTDKVTSERPADWDSGEELLAHTTSRAHSGAFGARLFPQENLTVPASCIAYRAGSAYAGDSCEVTNESSDESWGVRAGWNSRFDDTADNADPENPRTVVAFDAHGKATSYWAGANHPDSRHATE
jgi:hypothetical protein